MPQSDRTENILRFPIKEKKKAQERVSLSPIHKRWFFSFGGREEEHVKDQFGLKGGIWGKSTVYHAKTMLKGKMNLRGVYFTHSGPKNLKKGGRGQHFLASKLSTIVVQRKGKVGPKRGKNNTLENRPKKQDN